MSLDPTRTPVLLGLGQCLEREEVVTTVELCARAAERAFEDAPGIKDRVQRVSMVSVIFSPASEGAATEVCDRLSMGDVEREMTTPGGNTPQWLMNRACDEIVKGELETTLIVGAESTRSMKQTKPDQDFMRAGLETRDESGPKDEVVGASMRGMLSKAEIEANLVRPADTYPIFENALAAKLGTDPEGSRARIAAFMARSSEVAAKNPMAWFPSVRTADDIATATPANRLTAEPYTKCMNSFMNVDQGAALIVTTLAIARELGLEEQAIFPWAGANSADLVPIEREDLAASPAIRAAAAATFEAAGVTLDEIDFIDLYSCFPVAVEISAREIGLALDDPRGLTQTGGMSFFGGPGNNYTAHGIAAVALRLREGGRLGYVTGNGGILSKHSIGIYANEPPSRPFQLADTSAAQQAIQDSALEWTSEAEGDAVVDAGTVVYGRDGAPAFAPVIATLTDGRRVCAVADDATLPTLAGRTLEGRTIRVTGASPPKFSV
ncbi:MAG: hypothetical protein AAGC67_08270 [Myxococcota bacterium]